MTALIRAELLKLHTLRSTWWFAASTAVFVALATVVTMTWISAPGGSLDAGPAGFRDAMSAAGWASLATLLFGVLVATGEFRHNTAAAAFVVTPRRGRLMAAKAVAVTVAGVVAAVIATASTAAVALPWLAALGFDVDVAGAGVGGVLAGSAAGTVAFGLLGFGLGAAIRNQVGAMVAALGWIFAVEGTTASVLPWVDRWLPSGASDALAVQQTATSALLPVWAGGLVLLAWVVAAVVIGTRLATRRDVV